MMLSMTRSDSLPYATIQRSVDGWPASGSSDFDVESIAMFAEDTQDAGIVQKLDGRQRGTLSNSPLARAECVRVCASNRTYVTRRLLVLDLIAKRASRPSWLRPRMNL
jgi:hypothetical protein